MKGKIQKVALYALMGGVSITAFTSCKKEASTVTGWNYNDEKNGGFEVVDYQEQETGPGLILIEGGRFSMGRAEQDVMYDWNNIPRTVTVSSFYMDETEVANVHWREYSYWLNRVFGDEYPEIVRKNLPDTLVWRRVLSYNEPQVEYYYRHPAYNFYPVVGINWTQATDFCIWRSDRVNESVLIREGILNENPAQVGEDNFNTGAYLEGLYEGLVKNDMVSLDPNKDTRKVRIDDGILLPNYRLPTEAEWEFAASGLIGNMDGEIITDRKIYPWTGHWVRNKEDEFKGEMMANFVRGRGDHMGVAGNLNDKAHITNEIWAYWPNDFGLYNMAGNVAEWVLDVYRPLTFDDMDEFNPFRGNVFQTKLRDSQGYIEEKDSMGRLRMRPVDVELDDLANRDNYKKADNIDILDGDWGSSVYYGDESYKEDEKKKAKLMYEYGKGTLISNRSRVYKGGSWRDRVYWLGVGTRRYMDEHKSTDFIGFRCAMHRVGSAQVY